MEGTVLDSSYIGVSTQYLVETRDGHRMTAYAQNLETAGAAEALADGEKVRLTWQPRHTFVVTGPTTHVTGDPHAPEEEGELDV
jgi:spermidine/putrescine transport system ATP-binding protein